jgi:hypothetical protein
VSAESRPNPGKLATTYPSFVPPYFNLAYHFELTHLNIMTSIPIPKELLEEANEIHDLQNLVARFIKSEISRRQILKKRYSPEILSLVNEAFTEAEQLKISGFDEKQACLKMSKIHQSITVQ